MDKNGDFQKMSKRDKWVLGLIIGPVILIMITMSLVVFVTWQDPKPVPTKGVSSDF